MKKENIMTVGEIVLKTATSVIPMGGAFVACIIDEIKSKSMQRRQDEWLELLEERFVDIQEKLDDIGDNEKLTTAIIKATELAIKTAENEKREYLANAVINSIDFVAEESILMIYLDLLDQYTVWHLQILKHFYNPENEIGRGNDYMGGADIPLYRRYPHMLQNKELVGKIVNDLQNDGMLAQGSYVECTMTANGMYEKRTTNLGDGFLKFILPK